MIFIFLLEKFTDNEVEFCAISAANVRHCTESCAFFAQSVYNHNHIEEHTHLNQKEILESAEKMEDDWQLTTIKKSGH